MHINLTCLYKGAELIVFFTRTCRTFCLGEQTSTGNNLKLRKWPDQRLEKHLTDKIIIEIQILTWCKANR